MKAHRFCRIGLVSLLCLVVVAGLWLYSWLFYNLPSPREFEIYVASLDNTSSHIPVPLSEMPEALRQVAIATKDRDFYDHPANIDSDNILREIWHNLRYDHYGRDGASIGEWLVVNLMIVSGRRVENPRRQRMRELVLVILITPHYTKDEILESYLNSVYYGNGIYGPEAAAQFYYGKHIRDLDLAECAMLESIARLACLPDFDLSEDFERAKEGQKDVLGLMVEAGYLSGEEASLAWKETLSFVH